MKIASLERIVSAIHIVRGQRVMLDSDLAVLYGVTTRHLNQQVKRNAGRFPEDFMFAMTAQETSNLKSQFVTSSVTWGGRRTRPRVFTEHGALMLASVLGSPTAVQMSVLIVRAFVRLRQMVESNASLARKIDDLEKKYDSQFAVVFQAVRELMSPSKPTPKRIGFKTESRARYAGD